MKKSKKWDSTLHQLVSKTNLTEEKKKEALSVLKSTITVREHIGCMIRRYGADADKGIMLHEAAQEAESIIELLANYILNSEICVLHADTAGNPLLIISNPLTGDMQNGKADVRILS